MTLDRIAELKRLVPDDLVAQVMTAAATDPAFRDAFLADPKGAYRRRFGLELLPGQDIAVEQQADGPIHVHFPRLDAGFVVRPAAAASDAELSDDELELAVGGQAAQNTQAKGGDKSAFLKSIFGSGAGTSDANKNAA
jgi:hypothetical protein